MYLNYTHGFGSHPREVASTLTLHYDFVNNSTLASAAVVGPTPTFSRGDTNATFVDSNGDVVSVSTNDEPRFTHDPTGANPQLGILLEDVRTNEFTRSEELDHADWTKNNASVTADSTTSPSGATDADKITDDNSSGTGNVYVEQALTLTADADQVISVFAKADQLDHLKIEFNGFDESEGAWFDLTNGTVGTVEANIQRTQIEDFGNGWYRCTAVYNSTTDVAGFARFYVCDADNDVTVDLDGTSSIFLWGAQSEEGAFVSSYIPTTTASASRGQETLEETTNSGTWYSGAPFTVFEHFGIPVAAESFWHYFNIFKPSTVEINHKFLNPGSSNVRALSEFISGMDRLLITISVGTPSDAGEHKGAMAIAEDDGAFSWDGSASSTDSTIDVNTDTDVELRLFDNNAGTETCFGHVKEFKFWQERKSNSFIETETT